MRYALILVLLANPALGHSIEEHIADCACNSACYTDEVEGLSCNSREISFRGHGFPDESDVLMRGITGSNQQFPRPHDYRFRITRTPHMAAHPTATVPGAIGVAVNGIPIFDPSTQGPVRPSTGKPVSAAAAGELDICGGHAGRGDDYHYHRAPNCLIEELGRGFVDEARRPIGWAADGFPILALGWFDRGNDIEDKLDACRGATDGSGRYFYNVETRGDYAVLDCYSGVPQGFTRDTWEHRRDASGKEIIGIPIRFTVGTFQNIPAGRDLCSVMTGVLNGVDVLRGGRVEKVRGVEGTLYYCNSGCYGHFEEVKGAGRGRVVAFATATDRCPGSFTPAVDNGFSRYER
ncbi:YHYH protein [Pseudoruegeria sp. HB172150]|uniref:YHYH protein n=1 Tax=Pseudoruegeria sp. HB172150 TaxID=2721164 RepID=UPI001C13035A|nr:YHYH protein [Pseudoruegeria sp. HB172150]